MNTLPSRHKQCHFNLTMSPRYLVKLKIAQRPTAYCSAFCWIDCSEILQKVVQCLFLFLFSAVFWQKIFYIIMGFINNLSSNSISLILACKLKLSCRHLQHVTVMTSSGNSVAKLGYMWLWSIHSCFHWCKNYKNRPRNARVILENKVVPFYETWCGLA